jgi:hypothetical protein
LNSEITDLFTEDSLAAEFDANHHSTKVRAS